MNDSNRYQRQAEIGQGGMGRVYHALDTFLDREVALKVLAPHLSHNQALASRFRQEARLLARLEHPYIVPIYDAGEDEKGNLFLVMRLASGGTLRDRLAAGTLHSGQFLVAMAQAAQALDAAHDQGIRHGDIKPSNILFDARGVALVSDFGLAQLLSAAELPPIGTVAYTSPEQARGAAADGRSDQYSLAALIYEALAGRPPFTGEPEQVLQAHLQEIPPPVHTWNSQLSPAISDVVAQALAKEPSARFATHADFVAALQAAADNPALLAAPLPMAIGQDTATPTPPEALPGHSATELAAMEQAYEQGLVAMKAEEWEAAVDAFNQVAEIDRHYRSVLTLRQTAKRNLDAARRETAVPIGVETPPPAPPADQPSRRVVSGAGGSSVTRPEVGYGRSRKWVWLPVALLVIVVLVAAAWLWQQRSSQTAAVTTTLEATPTLPVTADNSITVVGSGAGAAWQVNGELVPLTNGNLISLPPDGQPITVQTSAPVILRLPDGTLLNLDEGSELEIRSVADIHDAAETMLQLIQGRLVAEAAGHTVIENPYGAKAQAITGLIGVAFSEDPFRFDVDCLVGECQVFGDLGGELTLVAGQHTFVGGSGHPAAVEPAHYELYAGLSDNAPTATAVPTLMATLPPTDTPVPPQTPTATMTPTATRTPRPTVEPSPTPTETPTVVFVNRPAPRLTRFTCASPGRYSPAQTIPFEWSWSGQLRGNEYLELRIGPQGSTNLTSIGTVPGDAQVVWPVAASTFFTMSAFDYHWEVVHMAANGRTVLARSARGCLHVAP